MLGTHGNRDLVPYDDSWSVLDAMTVLGHIIQPTGAINLDYDSTVRRMWQSFYANAGATGNAKLPLHAKISLIKRATLPHLDAHAARWPFTRERARWLAGPIVAAHDRQLYRHRVRTRRHCRIVCEEKELRSRCHSTENGQMVRQMGEVVSWRDHLLRERNSWAWGAQLLAIRTPQELEGRRLVLGRVHTRAVSGWCASRWCESVVIAKTHA